MSDFGAAVGLVLVIEGLLWAAAPSIGLRMLEFARNVPESQLRGAGAFAAAAGVFIVWLVRG